MREQTPGLVLLSSGGALGHSLPTFELTNRFILTGLGELRLDAMGVQWGDLAFGDALLQQAGLPLVASNWLSEGFSRSITVQRPAGSVEVFAWLDPASSPYRAMLGDHRQVGDDPAALVEAIGRSRSAGALTVLIASLSDGQAPPDWMTGVADLVIAPMTKEAFGDPGFRQGTLVLRPGSRGQALGVVTLTLDEQRRIDSWQHRVVTMPESVPDAARLTGWYDQYSEQLRTDYAQRVEAGKSLMKSTPYADERACAGCHPRAAKVWRGSAHARAFESLSKVDKTHDANCVGCHSIGFGEPGGFVSAGVSPFLRNVGCQACHGPAKQHLQTGGADPMASLAYKGEKVCAGCHQSAHSPSFDFAGYWSRITHPTKP
ncbi:MAG: multiheme c-type cytochrome [Burkholderiaceae bacterium]